MWDGKSSLEEEEYLSPSDPLDRSRGKIAPSNVLYFSSDQWSNDMLQGKANQKTNMAFPGIWLIQNLAGPPSLTTCLSLARRVSVLGTWNSPREQNLVSASRMTMSMDHKQLWLRLTTTLSIKVKPHASRWTTNDDDKTRSLGQIYFWVFLDIFLL